MKKQKIPVLVIFAPTASGKTALTFDLFGSGSHSFFKGKAEIISADSMQVYRGLDIGTAKPTLKERQELPHHLIDIASPDAQFSVADFVKLADDAAKDIYSRGKLPVVAGGTGFYIRSFLLGLPATPEPPSHIRAALREELETSGLEAMYGQLMAVDPESAGKINKNDAYRILRALEIYRTTGKPRGFFEAKISLREEYDFFTVILNRERDELFERINARVDLMFDSGLEDEVRSLIKSGLTSGMPGMQAIGYREFFEYGWDLVSDTSLIREKIKKNSRKYAKKQYVFMKGIPGARVYDIMPATGSENSAAFAIPEALHSDIKDFCNNVINC